MEVIEDNVLSKAELRKALLRTVINASIVVLDLFPVIAVPASIVEFLNIASSLARKVGITLPTLTPNVTGGIFGVGILGGILDFLTFEVLPFPSAIFIHGAQILHDIRPIHQYVQENDKLHSYLPITRFLNEISHKVLK